MRAKPEVRTAYEIFVCDGDRPTNAECLAECIREAEKTCLDPSSANLPPWDDRLDHHLDFLADQIDNLRDKGALSCW
jgi:hypothetical protein